MGVRRPQGCQPEGCWRVPRTAPRPRRGNLRLLCDSRARQGWSCNRVCQCPGLSVESSRAVDRSSQGGNNTEAGSRRAPHQDKTSRESGIVVSPWDGEGLNTRDLRCPASDFREILAPVFDNRCPEGTRQSSVALACRAASAARTAAMRIFTASLPRERTSRHLCLPRS